MHYFALSHRKTKLFNLPNLVNSEELWFLQKDLPQKLALELLKNSKRSDRELAKILKVSQPTISRTRHKLEKSGVIQEYTIIPDFRKLGFEIMALTFFKMNPEFFSPEFLEKARKGAEKVPDAIFISTGEGMRMTGVIISFHVNMTDYHRHLNMLRLDYKEVLEGVQSFVMPIGEAQFKKLSLKYLANYKPL
jgi:DNA-binding Lrp family transcriptional regulator